MQNSCSDWNASWGLPGRTCEARYPMLASVTSSLTFLGSYSDHSPHPWVLLEPFSHPRLPWGFLKSLSTLPISFSVFVAASMTGLHCFPKLQPLRHPPVPPSQQPPSFPHLPLTPDGTCVPLPPPPFSYQVQTSRLPQGVCSLSSSPIQHPARQPPNSQLIPPQPPSQGV